MTGLGARSSPRTSYWNNNVQRSIQRIRTKRGRNYVAPRQYHPRSDSHEKANIEFITLGVEPEGIDYQPCPERQLNKVGVHPEVYKKVPRDCMFDCLDVEQGKPPPNCTGKHLECFQAVWNDTHMANIAKRVLQTYEDHNRTRGAGKDFVALFFCRTGLHNSIAAATGLQRWLQYKHKFKIDVRVRHLMQHAIDSQNTCTTCNMCLNHPWRHVWERRLVEQKLNGQQNRP